MTEHTEFAIEVQSPTRWEKFMTWLTHFDEAVNYDPVVHTTKLVRDLGAQVSRLESRVIELERRTRRTT